GALPSESYTLIGVEKAVPTEAEASRFELTLKVVVAFAARLVPTGTMMSPIGSDGFNWPVIVLSDQPCTRSPVDVTRIPFLSIRKFPARVYTAVDGSVEAATGEPTAAARTTKNPSPWMAASRRPWVL